MGNWNTLRPEVDIGTFSPDTFAANLDQTPVDWTTSLAASAADTFTTSTTPGMAIREALTPDVPNKILAGGRGGVKWRPETSDEVAARGDTLISTPEGMKASKYWRDTMDTSQPTTEARMKAISEQIDLSTARRAVASEHPVAAFLGGAGITLLDPINYVPVFGEAATAAAAAKLGRFVGKTAIGAADAVVNTAIFDAAMLGDRKAHGDPMTLEQFGTDIAFAALAGTILSGTGAAITARADARKATQEALIATRTAQAQVHEKIIVNTAIDSFLEKNGLIKLPKVAQEAVRERAKAVDSVALKSVAKEVALVKGQLDLSKSPLRAAYAAGPTPPVHEVRAIIKDVAAGVATTTNQKITAIVAAMPEEIRTALKTEAETNARIEEAVKGKTEAEAEKIRSEAPATKNYYKAVQYVQKAADQHMADVKSSKPAINAEQLKDIISAKASSMNEVPAIVKEVTGRDAGLIQLTPEELSKVHERVMADVSKGGTYVAPMSQSDKTRFEAKALLGKDVPETDVRFDTYAQSKEEAETTLAVQQAQSEALSVVTATEPLDVQLAEAKAEGIDPETGKNDLEPQVKSILETLPEAQVKEHLAEMEAADLEVQKAQSYAKVLEKAQQCALV